MDLAQNKPSPERKEKKTRRRLRLSCVECTKRRQKCDRNYPCSLCVSRGVSHLCRWETVPVARPTPARPPDAVARSVSSRDATIQELNARIASLEKELAYHKSQSFSVVVDEKPLNLIGTSPSTSITYTDNGLRTSVSASPGSDQSRPSFSPEPFTPHDDDPTISLSVKPLNGTMYDTTSTLAQLCLAHHGEYIGRGSLICALHSISAGKTPRFLYAKSTDSTSVHREINKSGFSAVSSLNVGLEQLIQHIPPIEITNALVQAYFADVNWRFGIPQQWFHIACSQMWLAIQYPDARGLQINANWLSLLFAVLAYAPQDALHIYRTRGGQDPPEESTGDDFFTCSIAARRIAEDDHLKKPSLSLMASAADGTVLGCLAVPLLCCYLAERGRVSEAWKIVGTGLRNAEAVGMHRDPAWRQWQIMSEDERLLRRRAWWGLVIWDKLYSFVLGRPKMIRKEIFDVALPSLGDPDVKQDPFSLVQAVFIQLAGIVGETLEKCFSVEYPNCPVFLEMDRKFQQWEEQLPPEFQYGYDDSNTGINQYDPTYATIISRHRYSLHTWCLLIRMKLHIASITGQGRSPQSPAHVREGRRLCIQYSMRLVRLQIETWESATSCKGGTQYGLPGSNWYFEGCFSLFEAAVALVTTLTRYPWQEKISEAEQLIDRALVVFGQVAHEEEGKRGDIARMAVEVLTALGKEHWWRAQRGGDGVEPQPVTHEDGNGGGTGVIVEPVFNQAASLILPSPVQIYDWYTTSTSGGSDVNVGYGGGCAVTQHSTSALRESCIDGGGYRPRGSVRL